MKVVIIEDEALAAEKLAKMLLAYSKEIKVEATLTSVEDAITWLQEQPVPDLLFADIHLEDGLCFEIFQNVAVKCPVIFTTAFDQYAIETFQVHSIDYLLKPVQFEKLSRSLDKLKGLRGGFLETTSNVRFDDLAKYLKVEAHAYKSRFLVKSGSRIKAVKTDEIAYIYADRKLNMLVTKEGQRYPVDYTLDRLTTMLDPMLFFRVNRQLIIHFDAAVGIHPYFKGRIKLELNPPIEADVIISSERTPLFKTWLDK